MLGFKNIFNDLIRFFFKSKLDGIGYLRFFLSLRGRSPRFSFICHFIYRILYGYGAAFV